MLVSPDAWIWKTNRCRFIPECLEPVAMHDSTTRGLMSRGIVVISHITKHGGEG